MLISRLIFYLLLAGLGSTLAGDEKTGLVSTGASPHARLHDVPIHAVTLGEGFWHSRMRINQEKSIPELYRLLEEHGVVDNFRRLSGRKDVPRRGYLFTDSDLFKWMEAAALSLQSHANDQLKATLDHVIDDVVAAQQPDGYLNTYHTAMDSITRFSNFADNHELYCLGHLLQAGIAYARGSGEDKLLRAGIRYADYVLSQFGPGKRQCYPGHPEIEMALVELYRTTGDRKYLDFVRYLYTSVDLDKMDEKVDRRHLEYTFSGLPFTNRKELRSHAVRAMYACCGATDYFMESGDPAFRNTLKMLWNDYTRYKCYVTGGVGSRYDGEAFGHPYELPNERAYTETCAAIGSLMWNWRLLLASGEAVYADYLERAIYNGFLSGVSLDGLTYFYRNPLTSLGDNERRPWYNCTCCPPNVQRTIASVPALLYSTSTEGVWLHFYHTSTLNWHLEDGTPLLIRQNSEYPWKGIVELQIEPGRNTEFTLNLRIPDWAAGAKVTVNAAGIPETPQPGQYLALKRAWHKGDRVRLELPMQVQWVTSNPRARENQSSIAVLRGPLVYALEGVDHPAFPVFDVFVSKPEKMIFRESVNAELGNAVVLTTQAGVYEPPLLDAPLYHYGAWPRQGKEVEITLIPYYAWANRGAAAMQVWLPVDGR